MKYPHIQQHDEKDCGAACLAMISEFYGQKLTIAKIRGLIKVDSQGANIYGVVTGAEKIGFDSEGLEGSPDELLEGISNKEIKFPFMARIVNDEMFEHFIVVYGINKGKIIIGDPGKAQITKMTAEKFFEQWQGQIIIFEPNKNFEKKNERKGSFSKFFKYITCQKKMLVFVFFASLVVSLINIFGSFIFEYVIDDAVKTGDVSQEYAADEEEHDHDHSEHGGATFIEKAEEKLGIIFSNLNTVCISIICLYILQGLVQILRGYLLSLTAKRVEVPLTLNYYNHLVNLPAEFFGTRKTGELMSRFNDTEKIRSAVSTTTLTIMFDTLMAVICGIILFVMSHTLFGITMITMLIYAIIIFVFRRPIKSINHEIMENDAQVTSYLKESIDGIETVKAYQYEESSKTKTKNLFVKLADSIVKGSIIYNFQDSIVGVISSIGTVVLLWAGAYLCVENTITVGTLITFYYLLSYFLDPVKNLIDLQPELQTAIVAAERLNDVLEVSAENDADKKSISNLYGDIEFKNVDFRYGNRDLVLKDITMKFPQGKKIAIVGESGCGKTTLTKLLMSFYAPEKGSVIVDGKDLFEYKSSCIRNKIAYISQNVFIFSDSIYNNLRMGNKDISNEKIEEICKLCLADDFIQKLPMGYETVLEENGNNLSGGQKQRLAIARALLRNPDILIMDEATSNLDSITEESIKKTIDKLSDNMTCIIIAHRLKTIKNCDYIYVMDKGQIVEEGIHDELLKNNGLYSKNWDV